MPDRFARKWLAYDERRPTRTRLARRFAATIIVLLAVSALLALWLG